jgi:hypothetical protein
MPTYAGNCVAYHVRRTGPLLAGVVIKCFFITRLLTIACNDFSCLHSVCIHNKNAKMLFTFFGKSGRFANTSFLITVLDIDLSVFSIKCTYLLIYIHINKIGI